MTGGGDGKRGRHRRLADAALPGDDDDVRRRAKPAHVHPSHATGRDTGERAAAWWTDDVQPLPVRRRLLAALGCLVAAAFAWPSSADAQTPSSGNGIDIVQVNGLLDP